MINPNNNEYSQHKKEMNRYLDSFYRQRQAEETEERWSQFISNNDQCPNRVSVTGRFGPERNVEQTWFGVNPQISVLTLKKELVRKTGSIFDTEDSFNQYLIEKESCWSWACSDHELETAKEIAKETAKATGRALLAQCILAVTHEFSVEINIDSDIEIERMKTDLIRAIIFFEIKDDRILKVYGRLNVKQRETMERIYELREVEEKFFVKKKIEGSISPMTWNKVNTKLTCRESFYSGVLTNVCDISFEKENQMNNKFSNIRINVNKTTYATILGIGHAKLRRQKGTLYASYFLTDHPFLNTHKSYIEAYYKRERLLQTKYLGYDLIEQKLSSIEDNLKKYLKESLFPKPVSIAGNIVTSDDYLIYVKRGQGIENEGRLACSLTGYSEIHDPKVECYQGALEEEKPTIRIQDDREFSFGGEMAREAKAELGIPMTSSDWKYSGFILSRQSIPSEATGDSSCLTPSAVAFEVVGQARTTMSFLEVQEQQKISIEKDENEQVLGFKAKIYKNRTERLKSFFPKVLAGILVNKDLIILASLIYTFLVTNFLSDLREGILVTQLKPSVEVTINVIIYVALISSFIANVLEKFKKRKHKKRQTFLMHKMLHVNDIWNQLNKVLKINVQNTSYLFVVMMNLYIITQIKENEQDS